MSTLRPQRRLAAFIRKHGISQHYASHVLGVSQPSLSRYLNGRSIFTSSDDLKKFEQSIESWIDDTEQQEHLLYERLLPICREVPRGILRPVFQCILKDVIGG